MRVPSGIFDAGQPNDDFVDAMFSAGGGMCAEFSFTTRTGTRVRLRVTYTPRIPVELGSFTKDKRPVFSKFQVPLGLDVEGNPGHGPVENAEDDEV